MAAPHSPSPEDYDACFETAPRIVDTVCGPVEVAERGEGPPVLVLHGTLGGWDQGLVGGEFLRVNGYRVIAPSRPGYLGTPLSSGRTPAEQGDALAALLEALDIKRIPVVAVSGGGPAGYELAARHPTRISALVQVDSVCVPGRTPNRLSGIAVNDLTGRLQLLLLRHATKWTLTVLLRAAGTYSHREASTRAAALAAIPGRTVVLEATLRASIGSRRRKNGMRNDFTAFTPAALDRITCPTLLMHGRVDKLVPPANAELARTRISGSELTWLDGSHLAFTLEAADTAPTILLNWLRTAA
jgi:pimeloyl-ACP methyl ester carboxylesterase